MNWKRRASAGIARKKRSRRVQVFAVWVVLAVGVAGVTLLLQARQKPARSDSVFCWDQTKMAGQPLEQAVQLMQALSATRLFQYFGTEQGPERSKEVAAYLRRMQQEKIEVYALWGDPAFAVEEGAVRMKAEIDKAAAWNTLQGLNRAVTGVVIDVEPYGLEQWDAQQTQIMAQFAANMQNTYVYAKQKGLRVIVCVPNWYDKRYLQELERLVRDSCDELAIMNYKKDTEAKNIATELALAKQYNKPVLNIYEFSPPGEHGLTENNTYYTDGIAAAQKAFAQLCKTTKARRLSLGYHHMEPLLELQRKTGGFAGAFLP